MRRQELIREAIMRAVNGPQEANWERIKMYVSEVVIIENWLEVRGVLQWLINNRIIRRTQDVHREVYVLWHEI